MAIYKRVLGNGLVRRILCAMTAFYIWLVYRCGYWTVNGGEIPDHFWSSGKPFILCFWHGRLLMMPYCWRREVPINLLISRHRDGQIIAATIAYFGLRNIAGSSGRGGTMAMRAMVRALQCGECVGIAPDGPQGPCMRVGDGIVEIARLSGASVIPVAVATSHRRILGSWDRFILALPFSRGVFIWGKPITVMRNADVQSRVEAKLKIQTALNEVSYQADLYVGHGDITGASNKSNT